MPIASSTNRRRCWAATSPASTLPISSASPTSSWRRKHWRPIPRRSNTRPNSSIFSQLNGLLGQPGASTSLTSQLDAVSTALNSASAVAQFGDQPAGSADRRFKISPRPFPAFRLRSAACRARSTSRSPRRSARSTRWSADLFAQPADPDGAGAGQHLVRPSRSARPGRPEPLSIYRRPQTSTQADGQMLVSTQRRRQPCGREHLRPACPIAAARTAAIRPITLQTIDPATGQNVGPSQAMDSASGLGPARRPCQHARRRACEFPAGAGKFRAADRAGVQCPDRMRTPPFLRRQR